ncbi:hypothetical protein AMECASPLE_035924 [Ameca splendens]|uniref:Uncharacterized protein n=1 Tax=Ameca splendens TaxID=208324 RepID=A0ABV0ZSC4_9TELE
MSFCDLRGARLRKEVFWGAGWTGKQGCGNDRAAGMGYSKMEPPPHENQMKGRLDDSLGLLKEKKGKKAAHKTVRICLHFFIMQCSPDALLLMQHFMNVSIISQHVHCIFINVSNLALT